MPKTPGLDKKSAASIIANVKKLLHKEKKETSIKSQTPYQQSHTGHNSNIPDGTSKIYRKETFL